MKDAIHAFVVNDLQDGQHISSIFKNQTFNELVLNLYTIRVVFKLPLTNGSDYMIFYNLYLADTVSAAIDLNDPKMMTALGLPDT
jgi:hypothetical protein